MADLILMRRLADEDEDHRWLHAMHRLVSTAVAHAFAARPDFRLNRAYDTEYRSGPPSTD